jgi:DNA polymerase elongation subunit (family B)
MISENISPDSIVERGGEYDNLPDIDYLDIEYDIFVGKERRRVKSSSRFMQPKDGGKSLYPRILQKLLGARKNTRKKMQWKTVKCYNGSEYTIMINDENSDILRGININTSDKIELKKVDIESITPYFTDFQLAVLEGAQLAYKLTANSLYGQLGAPTSPIFYKELALSTTATGRKMLLMARKFAIERYNAEIIYGDTDSIFIRWPADIVPQGYKGLKSRDDQLLQYNVDRGCELSDEFREQLKKPHDLEWEKMFYPFILFGKKKYVGNLYEHDIKKYKQKNQGIVLQRRDNAKLVKTIYGGIIKILLNQRDFMGSIKFMNDSLSKLLAKEYDIEELVITRKLGYGYKFPERIAHKVLADRMMQRDPGSAPQVNDRIPYVYIYPRDKGKEKILEGEKIEELKYVRDNNIPINHAYYIEKQLVKPISQLYALELERLPGYSAKYAIDRNDINRVCKKCRENGIVAENCDDCDNTINKVYNERRQQAAIDILFGTRGYVKRMRKFMN